MSFSSLELLQNHADTLKGLGVPDATQLIRFTGPDAHALGLPISNEDAFGSAQTNGSILIDGEPQNYLEAFCKQHSLEGVIKPSWKSPNGLVQLNCYTVDGKNVVSLCVWDASKNKWALQGLYTDDVELQLKILGVDENLSVEIKAKLLTKPTYEIPSIYKDENNQACFDTGNPKQIELDLHRRNIIINGKSCTNKESLPKRQVGQVYPLDHFDQAMAEPIVAKLKEKLLYLKLQNPELDYEISSDTEIIFSDNETTGVIIERLNIVESFAGSGGGETKRYYPIPGYIRTEFKFDTDHYVITNVKASNKHALHMLDNFELLTNLDTALAMVEQERIETGEEQIYAQDTLDITHRNRTEVKIALLDCASYSDLENQLCSDSARQNNPIKLIEVYPAIAATTQLSAAEHKNRKGGTWVDDKYYAPGDTLPEEVQRSYKLNNVMPLQAAITNAIGEQNCSFHSDADLIIKKIAGETYYIAIEHDLKFVEKGNGGHVLSRINGACVTISKVDEYGNCTSRQTYTQNYSAINIALLINNPDNFISEALSHLSDSTVESARQSISNINLLFAAPPREKLIFKLETQKNVRLTPLLDKIKALDFENYTAEDLVLISKIVDKSIGLLRPNAILEDEALTEYAALMDEVFEKTRTLPHWRNNKLDYAMCGILIAVFLVGYILPIIANLPVIGFGLGIAAVTYCITGFISGVLALVKGRDMIDTHRAPAVKKWSPLYNKMQETKAAAENTTPTSSPSSALSTKRLSQSPSDKKH